MEYILKDIRFKDFNRNIQLFRIIFNDQAILFWISRIHDHKLHIKMDLRILMQFLKALCHQHRIFSARNTNRNPIPFFDQFIITYCLCKLWPDLFTICFNDASFRFFRKLYGIIFFHLIHDNGNISTMQTHRIISLIAQSKYNRNTQFSTITHNNDLLVTIKCILFNFIHW